MLLKELSQIDFTKSELVDAYEWSLNTKYLIESLSSSEFTIRRVQCILYYELKNRKRISVLKRLHARLCKLRNEEEWGEIEEKLGV